MKRTWLVIGIIGGVGALALVGWQLYSLSSALSYEVLSYQVQLLDANGITIRVFIALTNPARNDLELWNQRYEVFVAGYKLSTITSTERIRIIARNTSVIPLDVALTWKELQENILPLYSQSEVTTLADLPITIKGRLGAKLGLLKLSSLPVRASALLGQFLP